MDARHARPALLAGTLLALAATAVWSGNFIVARGLAQEVRPATLAFLRWATALAALLPLAGAAAWRERRTIRRHLGRLTATALLGVTVFNTLIYLAARSTSALNLSLIATSSPVFILIFARIFLGEALTPGRLLGLACALCGVVLLITRGDPGLLLRLTFAPGDLLMVLAAMIFAAYSILVRTKPQGLGQAAFLLSTFGLGLAGLAPWAAWETLAHGPPTLTAPLVGSILYVGLGASLAAFFLWNKAIEAFGPARAGLVYYSLPAFCGLEAWLILGEPAGWTHLSGGLLILGGVAAASRR